MGVYIPNWEKPKSCDECWAEYAYEICNSHSDCCPLIPVPPHGRLIDGDVAEVISFTDEDARGGNFADGVMYAVDFISEMPTIIEAEEGE